MMVKIFKMITFTVIAVATLATNAHAGYSYQVPSNNLQLPNDQQSNIHNRYTQQYVDYNTQPSQQSDVSYSVSNEDYHYLKQYKNGQKNVNYNYNTGHDFTPLTSHSHHDVNHNNNHDVNHNSNHYDNGGTDYSHGNEIRENSISASSVIKQNDGINLNNGYNTYNPGYVNVPSVQPVITKHIYFHVPPPDVEEKPRQVYPTQAPKKVYNIVFIKVPSQETRNLANLQRLLANQRQAPYEDKTLIYVLVNKPEPQPPQPPAPTNSQHEVFYVKYKGDANNAVSQINENLEQVNTVQSQIATPALQLQPGLLNGQL